MADPLHSANISPPPSGGNIPPTPPFHSAPTAPFDGIEHLPDYVAGSLNFNQGALRNSIVVPGRVVVYGFTAYSSLGSAQWIQVFDANTVPADTAVPLFVWNLAANSGVGFSFPPQGRQFQTGLVLCNSTTETTKTIGAANCFFDVQYDVYSNQNAPGTGA